MFRRCRLTLLAAGALAAWPATAQEALPSAEEILRKHVEARGGLDKLKALQSLKLTGKMTMGGGQMEAPVTIQVKRPGRMRMEMSVQGMSFVQAYDGSTAWGINSFQGVTEPQVSDEEATKTAREQADIEGPLVNYNDKGHLVELIGKEDVEGSSAYKIKVTRKNGWVDYHFLDEQSFLAVKTTTRRKQLGQELDAESFLSNYKPVQGILMPHLINQKVAGRGTMQMTMEKIEVNLPIDDAIFKMPAKEKKEIKEPASPKQP